MPLIQDFVTRAGSRLLLGEQEYRVHGANNYYLGFVPESVQTRVLDLAGSLGHNVLRIWAFFDAATPVPPEQQVCFRYLPPGAGAPLSREGDYGLTRLDRAISLCSRRNIRVILTLTNFHPDFGGMPRVAEWFNLPSAAATYRDPRARDAYRLWAAGLLARANPFTGRTYADEPAILAWELANEPRTTVRHGRDDLVEWATAMSAYLRAAGARQLIAAGDEDLLDGGLLRIPDIDFGTCHLYPWMARGRELEAFGRAWLRRQHETAAATGKPLLLEEYGIDPGSIGLPRRNAIYAAWRAELQALGALGDLVWMIGVPKDADQPYTPDPYVILPS